MPPGKLKVSKAKVDGGDVPSIWSNEIATSHDRWDPQKVAFWKGNGTPAISGKSSLVKYCNLARSIVEASIFHTLPKTNMAVENPP